MTNQEFNDLTERLAGQSFVCYTPVSCSDDSIGLRYVRFDVSGEDLTRMAQGALACQNLGAEEIEIYKRFNWSVPDFSTDCDRLEVSAVRPYHNLVSKATVRLWCMVDDCDSYVYSYYADLGEYAQEMSRALEEGRHSILIDPDGEHSLESAIQAFSLYENIRPTSN